VNLPTDTGPQATDTQPRAGNRRTRRGEEHSNPLLPESNVEEPNLMSDLNTTAGAPSDQNQNRPTYPNVAVRLSGTDGNAHMIIGRVAAALRREVGNTAADAFNNAAYDCTCYDQVLQLAMTTVTVS
jgi:hypothetical protein